MNASLRLQRLAARAALALPERVLGVAATPTVVDGQRLDPQLAVGLAWGRRFGPRLHELPPVEARRALDATFAVFNAAPVTMAHVHDELAPGPGGPIPVRIYVPRGHRGGLLVWFHGGGGVVGSIAASDAFVRDLADRAGCAVASVEYRLAPEHPHPAAIDDALAVWPWAVAGARRWGCDPARVGVGGDSFGGFLAAWVERRARATGRPRPRRVVLVYPLLDLTHTGASYALFADGFGLSLDLIHWFRRHYAPDPASWRPASPLWLEDVRAVAPTLLIGAGFDALRDEGRAWAARITAGGGEVDVRAHDDLIHGFIDMTGVCRAARAAVDDLAADLARTL